MIRFTSQRFQPRFEHTYPEHGQVRIPRVTRRITLISARSGSRSGQVSEGTGEVRR